MDKMGQQQPAPQVPSAEAAPPVGWRQAWEAWKRLAKKAGEHQAWLLLSLVYYLFLLPFWVGFRLFGERPGASYWKPSRQTPDEKDRYLRQF